MLRLSGLSALAGAGAVPLLTAGTADIAVTTATGSNSAQYISDLEVSNVTVGGKPVTS